MTIAPTPETTLVSPPQYRRHDDTPPEGHHLSDGPPTPRTDAEQALVDRETLSQVLRELLDARHLGLKAHEETQERVDALIVDVRTLNARFDDLQGKQGDQTTALKNLADHVGDLVSAVKLQTVAILKLEQRVARNEEEADDTKAAIATALGGEAKARESLASQSEITLTGIRLTVEEHEKKIGRFQSFLDKHLPTKTGRLAVVIGGVGAAAPVLRALWDLWSKLQ